MGAARGWHTTLVVVDGLLEEAVGRAEAFLLALAAVDVGEAVDAGGGPDVLGVSTL